MLTETTIDSVRNERLTGKTRLISSCDNVKHDLESLLEQIGFLLFSLSRELSPLLLHEHVLSLLVSKLFILSLHSLYKFHVSCFVFSHFNSLPPASLSLLIHFNWDFYDYLTRSRSTCIKCPLGINLLLVVKPRLFGQGYPTDIPLTVRNSLTITDFKNKLKLYFLISICY